MSNLGARTCTQILVSFLAGLAGLTGAAIAQDQYSALPVFYAQNNEAFAFVESDQGETFNFAGKMFHTDNAAFMSLDDPDIVAEKVLGFEYLEPSEFHEYATTQSATAGDVSASSASSVRFQTSETGLEITGWFEDQAEGGGAKSGGTGATSIFVVLDVNAVSLVEIDGCHLFDPKTLMQAEEFEQTGDNCSFLLDPEMMRERDAVIADIRTDMISDIRTESNTFSDATTLVLSNSTFAGIVAQYADPTQTGPQRKGRQTFRVAVSQLCKKNSKPICGAQNYRTDKKKHMCGPKPAPKIPTGSMTFVSLSTPELVVDISGVVGPVKTNGSTGNFANTFFDVHNGFPANANSNGKRLLLRPPNVSVDPLSSSAPDKQLIAGITKPAQVKIVVNAQTTFLSNQRPSDVSAYGRGTTQEDLRNGNVTLGFHELCHYEDAQAYFSQGNMPHYKAAVGMEYAEFGAELIKYQEALGKWWSGFTRFTTAKTECVGTPKPPFNGQKFCP